MAFILLDRPDVIAKAKPDSRRADRWNWFHLFSPLVLCFAMATDAWGLQSVVLMWDASPNTNVAGYFIYYGTNSEVCVKRGVGTALFARINDLMEGRTYWFAVTAYCVPGTESPCSPRLTYTVPGLVSLVPPGQAGEPMVVQFAVAPGQIYQLQASQDFVTWITLWTQTATTNQVVQVADPQSAMFNRRFYRVMVQ